MNKKYYMTPATEVIGLHVESNILAGSVEGFKGSLTEEEGTGELSRKKDFFDNAPWSDTGFDK